jgi:uncharacterized metal-binding protein YceD (DUF177 family)
MTAQQSPWSVPITVHDVPETGRRVELAASPAARDAIARAAKVQGLPRLEAVFDVTRHGRDGLRVQGRVFATVEQSCVVTLEPLHNEIDEQVDLVFVPQSAMYTEPESSGGKKRAASEEAPEALDGDSVDLGAIAIEFLNLAIDPYPRKPGVVFESPATSDDGAHPFAALAALKKGGHDG